MRQRLLVVLVVLMFTTVVLCDNGTAASPTPTITLPPTIQSQTTTTTTTTTTTVQPKQTTLAPTNPDERRCTEKDFGSTLGECDKATNTMLVVWYKKNDCVGDFPASTRTIPCDIKCKNGQVLRTPETSCRDCPTGTYSFSEGTNIASWSEEKRDPNIKTYCEGPGCRQNTG
jgi:hypothetical protein